MGYELEKRVFPFEGLLRATCRCDFDKEQRAVLAARPVGNYWISQWFMFWKKKNFDFLAWLGTLNP